MLSGVLDGYPVEVSNLDREFSARFVTGTATIGNADSNVP